MDGQGCPLDKFGRQNKICLYVYLCFFYSGETLHPLWRRTCQVNFYSDASLTLINTYDGHIYSLHNI